MNIYTKTGDKGKTSLFDNERVSKDDLRVESYGTVDEINSQLGLAKNFVDNEEIYNLIRGIQRKLFDVGAELATSDKEKTPTKIEEEDIKYLEEMIDKYMSKIKKPDHFIIPGTSKASGFLHVARTVCRRAERRIVSLSESVEVNANLVKYINRLSDVIYTLARYSERELDEVEFKDYNG